jgi:hypothetical protein
MILVGVLVQIDKWDTAFFLCPEISMLVVLLNALLMDPTESGLFNTEGLK